MRLFPLSRSRGGGKNEGMNKNNNKIIIIKSSRKRELLSQLKASQKELTKK